MGILSWLLGHGPTPDGNALEPRVARAIEVAVHGTDSRLRLLGNYEAKLRPAVETALAYCTDLAQNVPGPLELSPRGWGADPAMRALFARGDDIRELLRRSPELQAFARRPENAGTDPILAVLAMKRVDRTVLGSSLDGDVLRSDVPQRTVSFADHRLAAFCASEEELRQEIERRAYEHLVVEAVTRLTRIEQQERYHEGECRLFEARLQLFNGTRAGLAALETQAEADEQRFQELRTGLRENCERLAALRARAGTLAHRLERVAEVLARPSEVMHLTPVALRLTALNHVAAVDEEADAEVRLAEIAVTAPRPTIRVTVTVTIPRGEIATPEIDFAAAESWLR